MTRRPPRSTRTYTLFPYTTLFRSLAMRQMDAAGPIFAFDVGTREKAFVLLDALELVDISNNIGDARSLMCHSASTTHAGMSADARNEMSSEERRVGQDGVSTCRSRWSPYH